LTLCFIGANIAAMTREKPLTFSGVFRWVDTPWTVAAVLGIWGVMIGIEEFLAANIAASIAAIFATVRLGKETLIWTRKRHTPSFALGFFAIVALLGVDFWWTGHQKTESDDKKVQLSHLSEIPKLHDTINQMTRDEEVASKSQAVEQAKMEQKLSDIGSDNTRLKSSIEKKDAVLARIAQDQYALNFTPQVTVYTRDKVNELWFMNAGKTNIDISDIVCEQLSPTHTPKDNHHTVLITPNSSVSMGFSEEGLSTVLKEAPQHPDGEIPVDCKATIQTNDKKQYTLNFTWFFMVKDHTIFRSVGAANGVVPVI
jgi:hypothetical protein